MTHAIQRSTRTASKNLPATLTAPLTRKGPRHQPFAYLDHLPDVYAMRVCGTCMEPSMPDRSAAMFSQSEKYEVGDTVAIWVRPEIVGPGEFQVCIKRLTMPPPHYVKAFPFKEYPKSDVRAMLIVRKPTLANGWASCAETSSPSTSSSASKTQRDAERVPLQAAPFRQINRKREVQSAMSQSESVHHRTAPKLSHPRPRFHGRRRHAGRPDHHDGECQAPHRAPRQGAGKGDARSLRRPSCQDGRQRSHARRGHGV